jgi:glycosyltransferase involved in cell wall biosynthesis
VSRTTQTPPAGRSGASSPLVTIGIPAYNRPAELERAVRSALAQDHPDIEVLVSDDASTDPAVLTVATRLAATDPRVRVVRQPRNLGHAANYQWVLEAGQGEYFMWLSDDDWIDPHYVSACLACLRSDSSARLVCGLGRYYRHGEYVLDERPIHLTSEHPGLRVVRYFGRVSLNGPLFGVARRADLLAVGFPQQVGGDWLLVAAIAARGQVRTLTDVHVHRSLDGMGSDAKGLARSFGIPNLLAERHHLLVAARAWRRITHTDPAYRAMGVVSRMLVGSCVAAVIVARFPGVDLMRRVLGADRAAAVEERISSALRRRDAR